MLIQVTGVVHVSSYINILVFIQSWNPFCVLATILPLYGEDVQGGTDYDRKLNVVKFNRR